MKNRKCNYCKTKQPVDTLLIKWIKCFCNNDCYSNYITDQKETKTSVIQIKAINKVSKTNSNTQAKFKTETKAKILIRDKHCIICWNWISDYHHIFYWWQAEHWPDRNNPEKGVWLCSSCHHNIHHWNSWLSQELRYKCIDYINNL